MSGFAGLFWRTGDDATAADLEAMTEAVAHRGPDGRGTWHDGPVGLGHRQLQTTPESVHDSLPRRDGNCVITMDARVDNRTTLCKSLGIDERSTVTDSQLLLASYDEWGVECFERIVGAFAVAIYDRERHRMVCARDHMGIKPFYYALDDRRFAFGSEPKAVLSLPDVPAEIDDVSVFAFLVDRFEDYEATFFESVDRLPPGYVLIVEPEDARKRSYWSLDPTRELDLPSDEVYERRFSELFTEAVRCRLRSRGEIASYLSGGIDSTSIACTAQSELAPEKSLQTFSVTHKGYPESDDSSYIEAVLDEYDFDAHVVDRGGATPLPNLDSRLNHLDAPLYPPLFIIPQWFANEFREADRRIVLDGLGGDQTLHYGTSYLTEYLLAGRLGHFWNELNGCADFWNRSRRNLVFETVIRPFAPEPFRWAWRWLRDDTDSVASDPLLRTERATDIGLKDRLTVSDVPPIHHREEHKRALVDPVQLFFFEVSDAEHARFGIEPRYPYFDRRLVEFCLALPADQKIRDGVGRHIIRRALHGTLPSVVQNRTDKADFSPSVVDGLYTHEQNPLRERIVQSPRYVTRYVNDEAIEEAYQRFSTEPSYSDAWSLTKTYALETWLRSVAEESNIDCQT